LGFGLWVAWGKGWSVEGEALAASGAGCRGWQIPARGPPAVAVGGRRAAVQLRVGAEVLWVALGMVEEAAPAASSLAAVADGVGLRPEQGATAL
jgi:hypothetical protein